MSDRGRWGRDGATAEVIYIDAADQAEADERRPLRHLPPGVACVITTRPDQRWLRPGSSYLIPIRLSECEIPPIELTPMRALQDIQHEDLFPEAHRPAALARLFQSLAAAKRERA